MSKPYTEESAHREVMEELLGMLLTEIKEIKELLIAAKNKTRTCSVCGKGDCAAVTGIME